MFDIEAVRTQLRQSYDQYPYHSRVFRWTAPGYLRAAAYLYGLETPPVKGARILELGCAAGGNSLPTAFLYPESEVVAIDVSPVQIQAGQSIADRAGLTNIQFQARCLSQLSPDLGQFDYIIAHGVWSWVPPPLQDALLQVIRRHLQPYGLAYMSFNTYPGWKLHELVRDWMRWHTTEGTTPAQQAQQAQHSSQFLAQALGIGPLQEGLRQLTQQIPTGAANHYYLAHEYLETHNFPNYLREVAGQAANYGLQHVGEVEPWHECPSSYDLPVTYQTYVTGLKHRVQQQQALDFAVGRSFRKSLWTHQAHWEQAMHTVAAEHQSAEAVTGAPQWDRLRELQFAGWFVPQAHAPDTAAEPHAERMARPASTQPLGQVPRSTVRYDSLHGTLSLKDPRIMAMLELLQHSWPRPVSGHNLEDWLCTRGYSAEGALKSLVQQVPVDINRAYADLPDCLQDDFVGLVPGVAALALDRQDYELPISDFNAWYQPSLDHYNDTERFILQQLKQGHTPMQASVALHQAWQDGQYLCPRLYTTTLPLAQAALASVEKLVATLRKYAMYL